MGDPVLHTVKRHMARIFDKTGQSSRSQAAAWYDTRHAPQTIAPKAQLNARSP